MILIARRITKLQAIANSLKDAIAGSIINIASVNGANRLRTDLTGYFASKAAVIQMTKALVGETFSRKYSN